MDEVFSKEGKPVGSPGNQEQAPFTEHSQCYGVCVVQDGIESFWCPQCPNHPNNKKNPFNNMETK